jgi:hypothetical protein
VISVGELSSKLLQFKARRLFRRFERAAHDPEKAQAESLLAKIRRNRDSCFGADHDFHGIRSVADFRKSLPVADYSVFEPYVERVKRGELRAMFGGRERLLMFAVTSGTYSRPKYIPVTRTFLGEYEFGWHVWGHMVALTRLPALTHSVLRIVSPSNESYTSAGIPCGAISGLTAEMLPRLIRRKYVPPCDVAAVRHAPGKYYLTGRIAVACRVSMITSANPSSVLSVVRSVDENREKIVRDLHDGTVDDSWEIPAELRDRLGPWLRPCPQRARALEDIITRTGRLLPKDYWPELRLIGNWKGASSALYLVHYGEYFGDVPVREIGLLASEGRMSIALSDETSSGVLDVLSHFFEFIPEEEMESTSPTVLLAHELEPDRNYYILLTTSSGLYRYNIMDLVRVTGFFAKTPEIEFLGKGHYFSSMTGEKVSEFQVVEGVKQARHAYDGQARTRPEHVSDACILSPMLGDPCRYSLAVESRDGCPDQSWRQFLRRFEERLCSINVEYRSKRNSGRLGAVVLHLLKPGTFDAMKEERLTEMGGRTEQYKHRFLVSEVDYWKKLPVEQTVSLEGEKQTGGLRLET